MAKKIQKITMEDLKNPKEEGKKIQYNPEDSKTFGEMIGTEGKKRIEEGLKLAYESEKVFLILGREIERKDGTVGIQNMFISREMSGMEIFRVVTEGITKSKKE